MPLFVRKKDSSKEVYLHTKVMGTIGIALSETGTYKEHVTEALSEAVSSYVSRHYESNDHHNDVPSDEILAMIEAVLCETGHGQAALNLRNHAINRQMMRKRIEVIHWWPFSPHQPPEANDAATERDSNSGPAKSKPPDQVPHHRVDLSNYDFMSYYTEPWNKSVIINTLKSDVGIPLPMARMIAGIIEDKVLHLGLRRIFSSVIKELVRNELWELSQMQDSTGQPAVPQSAGSEPSTTIRETVQDTTTPHSPNQAVKQP